MTGAVAGTAYGRWRVRGRPAAFRLQRRQADARAAARRQHHGARRRRSARGHATGQRHQVQTVSGGQFLLREYAAACYSMLREHSFSRPSFHAPSSDTALDMACTLFAGDRQRRS